MGLQAVRAVFETSSAAARRCSARSGGGVHGAVASRIFGRTALLQHGQLHRPRAQGDGFFIVTAWSTGERLAPRAPVSSRSAEGQARQRTASRSRATRLPDGTSGVRGRYLSPPAPTSRRQRSHDNLDQPPTSTERQRCRRAVGSRTRPTSAKVFDLSNAHAIDVYFTR